MHARIVRLLEIALQNMKNDGVIPDDLCFAIVVRKHRDIEGQWFSALAVKIASALYQSPQSVVYKLRDALPSHPLIEKIEITKSGALIFVLSHDEMSKTVATIVGEQGFNVQFYLGSLTTTQLSDTVIYPIFKRTCGILETLSLQGVVWDVVNGCANIANLSTIDEKIIVGMLYRAWQSSRLDASLDKDFNRLLAKCVQSYYNAVALLAMPKAVSDARLCLLEAIAVVLYERLPDTTRLAEN